jgi:hypothetical protein
MDTNKILRNVSKTLKARAKQEEKPTRMGEPVDLKVWLTEYLKLPDAVEGQPAPTQTAIQKHLSETAVTEVKDGAGRVSALETEHVTATIEVAKIKIEEKPYDMEYASLTAKTALGRLLLCDGVDDITFKGEGEEKREVPSVTKYFNTAFSQNARNAASARIRSKVEGPDKALASAAKKLAGVWGITVEQAAAKIKAMGAS